jgi:phage shock protein C
MEKHLYRSRDGRMIAGVCGGLAEYFGLDPTVIRIAAVLLACLDGVGVIAYVVLWMVVPEEGGTPVYQTWTTGPATEPKAAGPADTAVPDAPVAPVPASTAPIPAAPAGPRRAGLTAGLVLIAIGVLFMVSRFVPGIDILRLWPLLLIVIGVSMILRSGRRSSR